MKKKKEVKKKKNVVSRKVLVTALALVVVLSFVVVLNQIGTGNPNLSGMVITELHEHTLNQAEVDEVIGGEQIMMKRVDTVKTYSQADVDALGADCEGDVRVGDNIKIVAFYTSTREVSAIWLDDSSELACVTQKGR